VYGQVRPRATQVTIVSSEARSALKAQTTEWRMQTDALSRVATAIGSHSRLNGAIAIDSAIF
jgi:hypothetical protein